jgi:hypothetical protein
MAIDIHIEKKHLYLLSAIMVFLVGVTIVIAIGAPSYNIHGHDAGEIEGGGGIGTVEVGSLTLSYGDSPQLLPIPGGYTKEQCSYSVSFGDVGIGIGTTKGSYSVAFDGQLIKVDENWNVDYCVLIHEDQRCLSSDDNLDFAIIYYVIKCE